MIVEDLARNIVQASFEIFDSGVILQAKNRLIDIIGCTMGGANAPGCSELRDLVLEWGGKRQATIVGHGGMAPACNVAMMNSIMARSFDYGVITPYIGTRAIWAHIAETNVPTAMTAAEWKHASGKELLTAMILGDDVATRISAASTPAASTRAPSTSWDTPGTVNKFGAAAIACKLLGLNEHQVVNAFGIVLNQLAGSFQGIQDGAHSFKLAQGLSARDGIIAAELAARGWTGGKDPLLGKYGYFALYSQDYDPEALTRDLGVKFYGDCTFKPYPCCRFIHSTIDCALKLVQGHTINAEDIASITVDVAPMHVDSPLNQPFDLGEFPQGNATFSLRYHVANVLMRRSVQLEHLTEELIRDPEVGALARKVHVTGTIPPEKMEAAGVRILMRDGQEFTAYVDVATGNPLEKPLSKKQIEDKFRDNVAFSRIIPRGNAETILDMLNHLDEIGDITGVVELLTVE